MAYMFGNSFGRALLTLALCISGSGATLEAAELQSDTIAAFNRYMAATQMRFATELRPGGAFLYIDSLPADAKHDSYQQLKSGGILVQKMETRMPGGDSEIPHGMVHHWAGLIYIPGVTLAQVLPIVKDYSHREQIYRPDVIASRMIEHKGDDYKIFFRLYQKKFTTVIFNTNYDVHWGQVDPNKLYSNSYSTRIAEVKDSAQPDGEEIAAGSDHGYLWRLNTFWRFEESDGGVYMQCEAVSLTRDMPPGLGWLLRPLVTSIPKQSLNRALGQTREAVLQLARHE